MHFYQMAPTMVAPSTKWLLQEAEPSLHTYTRDRGMENINIHRGLVMENYTSKKDDQRGNVKTKQRDKNTKGGRCALMVPSPHCLLADAVYRFWILLQ